MHGCTVTIKKIAVALCLPWLTTVCLATPVSAQYPTVLPPGAATRTSPEVGDLQGIQRFGEQLLSDPDQGLGFTYRVLPTAPQPSGMSQSSMLWAMAHLQEAQELKEYYYQLAELQQKHAVETEATEQARLDRQIRYCQLKIEQIGAGLKLMLGEQASPAMLGRYATPNTPLYGQRNYASAEYRVYSNSPPQPPCNAAAAMMPLATDNLKLAGIGVSGTLSASPTGQTLVTLYNQPLIQIKVRVVEASRQNAAEFRSVLERMGPRPAASLVTANNLNGNTQSWRAGSRFQRSTGLLGEAALPTTTGTTYTGSFGTMSGSGTLVNLTTAHINFLTDMLVTEFKGDVLTVPEVVTLNGQLTELAVGTNRPLPLGLTFVQANGAVRQDVFYKHIGSLMRITPRVVNWGKNSDGQGQSPLVAQEVNNWNRLAEWMLDEKNILLPQTLKPILNLYARNSTPIPTSTKEQMLTALEQFPAQELRQRIWASEPVVAEPVVSGNTLTDSAQAVYLAQHAQTSATNVPQNSGRNEVNNVAWQSSTAIDSGVVTAEGMVNALACDNSILRVPTGQACDWKPEDCTIDLEIMMRSSSMRADNVTEAATGISNIVQVKSGHGVVMGGLLSSREIESLSKIPLLGDLPAVGFLFRSKSLDRAKSELIIMVEAEVLPPSSDPATRHKAAADFQLGQGHVSGELLDSPLQTGMFRAGFSSYLPPSRAGEDLYWTRHGQRMRKVVTEVDDTLK